MSTQTCSRLEYWLVIVFLELLLVLETLCCCQVCNLYLLASWRLQIRFDNGALWLLFGSLSIIWLSKVVTGGICLIVKHHHVVVRPSRHKATFVGGVEVILSLVSFGKELIRSYIAILLHQIRLGFRKHLLAHKHFILLCLTHVWLILFNPALLCCLMHLIVELAESVVQSQLWRS